MSLSTDIIEYIDRERDHHRKYSEFLGRIIYQLMERQGITEFEVPAALPLVEEQAPLMGGGFTVATINPNCPGLSISWGGEHAAFDYDAPATVRIGHR